MRLPPLVFVWIVSLGTSASAATYLVDTNEDRYDAAPRDGMCATEHGTCSLRAALQTAERSLDVDNTIRVPAGRFLLTELGGPNGKPWPLVIEAGAVRIVGAGPDQTIIDSQGRSRVFRLQQRRRGPSPRVELTNLTVRGGHAGRSATRCALQRGGGICARGALVVLDNVVVEDNDASFGGGLYASGGHVIVRRSTFRRNFGESYGGGLYLQAANGDVEDSVFHHNVAGNEGLAIYGGAGIGLAQGNTHRIRNTTISRNRSLTGIGAGISIITFCVPGLQCDPEGVLDVTLENVTIAGNEGVGLSHVYLGVPRPLPEVWLSHTVVTRNTRGDCSGGLISLGHNALSTASASPLGLPCRIENVQDTDFLNRNIRVDPLADNGGPTLTMLPPAGSLLIDGGADTCVDADQRGVPRPQGERCDVGAAERIDNPMPNRRPSRFGRRIPRR